MDKEEKDVFDYLMQTSKDEDDWKEHLKMQTPLLISICCKLTRLEKEMRK